MTFPDKSIFLWGGETVVGDNIQRIGNFLLFILILSLIIFVFVFAGSALGAIFSKLPTLIAYSWDLAGSLMGVAVFTLLNFTNTGPHIWLLLGSLPFVFISKKVHSIVLCLVVVLLGFLSVNGALYSPYNRIDLIKTAPQQFEIEVNRDFHQFMHNLSDQFINSASITKQQKKDAGIIRQIYDLPFIVNNAKDNALIVGAGTGNDVQAAIRNNYKEIYSVDIDREIIALGRQLHPEKPYNQKHVHTIVKDARAFFEQYQGPLFDIVCFGLLDSHAMFSSFSSLRLDNYVYTREGIRSAWNLVSEEGHLSISFSIFAGQWIFDRLYWTIKEATGVHPIALYNGMHYGATFIVAKKPQNIQYAPLRNFKPIKFSKLEQEVKKLTDNWPFLYIKPGHIPYGYILVLLFLTTTTFIASYFTFGKGSFIKNFDFPIFLMGAAFLLIETRGITSLSLLMGSTWVVNSSIFFTILLMAFLANQVVYRFKIHFTSIWFILLILSTLMLAFFDFSTLNQLPILQRGIIGGLINALPIFFSGIIVPIMLNRSTNPTISLGSNLLGAVIGGSAEYLSMYLGLQSLGFMAFAIYCTAMLTYSFRSR
jgi:hypothetical protein